MRLVIAIILGLCSLSQAAVIYHRPSNVQEVIPLEIGQQVRNVLRMPRDWHINYVGYCVVFMHDSEQAAGSMSFRMTVEAWGSQYVVRDHTIERRSTVPTASLNFFGLSLYAEAGVEYAFTFEVLDKTDDFNATVCVPGDGWFVTTLTAETVTVPEPSLMPILLLSLGLLKRR